MLRANLQIRSRPWRMENSLRKPSHINWLRNAHRVLGKSDDLFVSLDIACCSVNWICCVLPAASWRKCFNGRISAGAHTER